MMKPEELRSRDADILASEAAIRRDARRAREFDRKTGTPAYVFKNGRIVDLTEEWKRRSRTRVGARAVGR